MMIIYNILMEFDQPLGITFQV